MSTSNPNPTNNPNARTPVPTSSTTPNTAIPVPAPSADSSMNLERWNSLFYNTSLGISIAAPLVIALPPRKLDLYTFGLGICWFMSLGYVVERNTGKGLLWQIGSRIPSAGNRRRRREEAEEERSKILQWQGEKNIGGSSVQRAIEEEREREELEEKRGVFKRIWMGGESDDWVKERGRKEEEAFEEGRGYGGLIMDQVKEAFGVKKDEDDEDDDE